MKNRLTDRLLPSCGHEFAKKPLIIAIVASGIGFFIGFIVGRRRRKATKATVGETPSHPPDRQRAENAGGQETDDAPEAKDDDSGNWGSLATILTKRLLRALLTKYTQSVSDSRSGG